METMFEVELIGRELVKSVNATLLANIISDLVKKQDKHYNRHILTCRDKLQLVKKVKKIEDEGFESENDSVISNDDSYLVDDHVLKRVVGNSDSANSSGSSDTDDTDSHNLLIRNEGKEEYNIADVIFCHTETKFPNIIAWVVKKNLHQTEYRLTKSGVENIKNGLEVIVVKCKNQENLRDICFNYKENSRRLKLDKGYRKTVSATEGKKVSLDDIKVTSSTLIKSSLLHITNRTINVDRHKLTSSVSLNSLLQNKRDDITKTQSLSNVSGKTVKQNLNKYNLVQRTDNGVTHIEILHDSKSKLRKEIEGIIVTDVDIKRDPIRQQESEAPPIRPERRRYLRKKDSVNENLVEQKSKTLLDTMGKSKYTHPTEHADNHKSLYTKVDPEGNLGRWNKNDEEIRKRSKSVDRLKILPRKTPMAYRYIDITDRPSNTSKKEQRRRRNSLDELVIKNSKPNIHQLKPVIKKNKKSKNSEPKKVTFSAFATVQVVD